jgi:hypothetical protein
MKDLLKLIFDNFPEALMLIIFIGLLIGIILDIVLS